jgi:hypothetical protein
VKSPSFSAELASDLLIDLTNILSEWLGLLMFLRWTIIFFSLFLMFRAVAAYSQDICVDESVKFARCVDDCLLDKTCSTPKDVFQGICATAAKAYLDCGQIAKDAEAKKFVQDRFAELKNESPSETGPVLR